MPYKTKEPMVKESVDTIFQDDLDFATIEEIRKETYWPYDYVSTKQLVPYIKRLKGNEVVGIEVGTGKGESAYLILEECPNVKTLYTIDHYLEFSNWKETIKQEQQDKHKEIARKNLETFGDRAKLCIMSSSTPIVVPRFDHQTVDFIYLDGEDTEEGTYRDIQYYYPLLRVGGLFALHNFQLDPVREALMKFRNNQKVRIPIQRIDPFVCFWYKA